MSLALDGNWNVVRDGYKNNVSNINTIDNTDSSWYNQDDQEDLPF